jgi:hypothetical protein
MAPVIDHTELRLLRIAYRRAHGSAEMPDAEFLRELAHVLKNQIPSNADQRDESELFYEYQSRKSGDYAEFDSRVASTNDEEVCNDSADQRRLRSPLARDVCRQVELIQGQLVRIQPGWFHVGRKKDVPKSACHVGRYRGCYVWVGPEGCDALTEFTLTVMKFSSLIKETQTLLSPGQVKFSPGDRPG